MNQKKSKWLTIVTSLVITVGMNATNLLNVHEKTSANTTYETNMVQKLTFPGSNLVVTNKDATTSTFTRTNVAYMNFTINIATEVNTASSFQSINLYPNPAKDFMTIEVPSLSTPSDIQFIGIDGKLVLCSKLVNLKTTISISNLPKGIYLCRYNNGTISSNIKFIKQ